MRSMCLRNFVRFKNMLAVFLAIVFLSGSVYALPPGFGTAMGEAMETYGALQAAEVVAEIEAIYNWLAVKLVAAEVLTRFTIRLADRDWMSQFHYLQSCKMGVRNTIALLKSEILEVYTAEAMTAAGRQIDAEADELREMIKRLAQESNRPVPGRR